MNKNTYFKVLDKGFVGIVDWMGNDEAIVDSARVSYGKNTIKKSGTKELIRYLMRCEHTSPFEQVELKYHLRLPIFVMRQLVRHRCVNLNEVSGRYSELPTDFYEPKLERYKFQSETNKQGSSDKAIPKEKIHEFIHQQEYNRGFTRHLYQNALDMGMSREIARIDLPVSTYTEIYWKIDLRNLFHFLKLRLDSHAQEEIRNYAFTIACITKQLFPIAFEAFLDYELNSIRFSGPECQTLGEMSNIIGDVELYGINNNILSKIYNLEGREVKEFIDKTQSLRNPKYNLNNFNMTKLKNYEKKD
jgi:thymidylate synthase (FAD)